MGAGHLRNLLLSLSADLAAAARVKARMSLIQRPTNRWRPTTSAFRRQRVLELRVVEHVEELEAELHFDALRYLEVLINAEVDVVVAWASAEADAGITDLAKLIAVHSVQSRVQPLGLVTCIRTAGLT